MREFETLEQQKVSEWESFEQEERRKFEVEEEQEQTQQEFAVLGTCYSKLLNQQDLSWLL